jgi:predicted amidohydrolase
MKKLNKLIMRYLFLVLILFFMAHRNLEAQENKSTEPLMISGLQMDVTNDIEANRDIIMDGIRKAAAEGSRFLVTPEGSLSGYTSNFNQKELSEALKVVTAEASRLKVGLLLGTCYKKEMQGREVCYNQVRVYNPDGSFAGQYSKILRCSTLDMPGTGEMIDYAEGELKTFECEGKRFGILICNDLWATPGYTTMPNPYLVWKLKQMGVQFIVHCINSGTSQKYRPFHESSAELWASSVRLPIVEVNAAHGKEKINARSGLIDVNGERIVSVPDIGQQFFTLKVYPSEIKPSME